MDFRNSEEQQMLQDMLRRFLVDAYPFKRRVEAIRSESGWQPEIWAALSKELGLMGIGIAEALGGSGGGPVEHMIVMEELGRALVVEPFMETVIIGGTALSTDGGIFSRDILQSVIGGDAVIAFAWAEPGMRLSLERTVTNGRRDGDGWTLNGRKSVVTAAPWANWVLVPARTGTTAGDDRLSLFLVEKPAKGLSEQSYPTIDGRQASDLLFENVALPRHALLGEEGQAAPLVAALIDRAIAAIAAEAVGAMDKMHGDTVDYVKQRNQFGKPLSSFQVLQHRMVDMYLHLEMARSASLLATLKLDADPDMRTQAVSSAKITIANACRYVGQNAVQLHGGIGTTDDLAVSHYFKRTTMIEREFGGVDDHVARSARLLASVKYAA